MTAAIDTVALLLADRSPALRYRALVEVDGTPAGDDEAMALAGEIASSHEVDDVVRSISSGDDDPRALSFALSRLSYLGLGRGHAVVDDVVERLFASQRPDGSWPAPASTIKPAEEGYQWRPLQTALPLRGVAEAGFATDPRAERAFDWLLEHRFDDGSWPFGFAAGRAGYVAGYRALPQSPGCRATTTGALACLAHHPVRRASPETRAALDILLRRETRDEWALGAEVARLLGVEPRRGFATFYARFDLVFLLDLATRIGIAAGDPRVADLVVFLESKRGPYGLWDHPSHPHLSRWLTLDLLASMRRLEGGDWKGSDLRVPFTPYPRRRRRY